LKLVNTIKITAGKYLKKVGVCFKRNSRRPQSEREAQNRAGPGGVKGGSFK